jgi:acyl-CoA thioesterase
MRLASVAPGRAEMTMTVREDMLNGHAMCHGGFIFLLADSTFAFACNSYNRNTVAQGCSIDYLAPAHGGDVLRATGVERSRSGRTGVYDIDVRNQEGRTVALFRGKSYRIDGHVVDETQIL